LTNGGVREDDNVTGILASPEYCSTKQSVLNENATKMNNFLGSYKWTFNGYT